jgi:cyclophilin family peptidyl-prolyl cis-trans isomerase
MAAHKAATAVTIAPIHEKSIFARLVERYWKLATLAFVAIAGGVIFLQASKQSLEVRDRESWARLLAAAGGDEATSMIDGAAADYLAVAPQVNEAAAAPWALYLAAVAAADQDDYQTARTALEKLRTTHAAHPLVRLEYDLPGAEAQASVVEHLERRIQASLDWRAARPRLFANPAPATDAPRVRIRTDKGDLVVGLYPEEAQQHCENFLKLVREGFYNGTKFHRVIPGFMIQAGDPNTISGEIATWGQGGPGYKVPREENTLKHFPGVLAAAKQGNETESSGSQFYITTANAHHLDGKHVVFGKLLEGSEVATSIERSPIATGTADRPETPAVIQSMEILGG